jgi:hypothetical protein
MSRMSQECYPIRVASSSAASLAIGTMGTILRFFDPRRSKLGSQGALLYWSLPRVAVLVGVGVAVGAVIDWLG